MIKKFLTYMKECGWNIEMKKKQGFNMVFEECESVADSFEDFMKKIMNHELQL